jgi:hypothetical protein
VRPGWYLLTVALTLAGCAGAGAQGSVDVALDTPPAASVRRPQKTVPEAPAPLPLPSPRRQPTAVDPMRVMVIGDSQGVVLVDGFAAAFGQTGRADVFGHAWWAFGLTAGYEAQAPDDGRLLWPASAPYGTWPERYRALVEELDPDAVVAYLGAFDLFPRRVGDRLLVPPSREWRAWYDALLDEAVDLLSARGAVVYMLGPPCDHRGRDDGAQLLATVFDDLARRRPTAVEHVPLDPLLCPEGVPTDFVWNGGNLVQVFANHFTPEGARLVGDWFVARVAQQWGLAGS